MTSSAPEAIGGAATTERPLLEVSDLVKHFPIRGGLFGARATGQVQAVDGVSFQVNRGETVALVGESGCGKSTTARSLLRLIEPTSGTVHLDGQDITALSKQDLRRARRKMQIIFQDPYASLNPRMTIRQTLSEKYKLLDADFTDHTISDLLERVGLSADHAERYPHEFSGGQRQRVGIARAIALDPAFVVLDEPVSALDVSIQAQIVNLLEEIQDDLGLTYLFIAHDLSVVRHISDRVAVMYLGSIVEWASRDQIFDQPHHPYTQALISAVPIPDPKLEAQREAIVLTGDVPNPANPPSGCRFRTRCWKFLELTEAERKPCIEQRPTLDLLPTGAEHQVACHYPAPRVVATA